VHGLSSRAAQLLPALQNEVITKLFTWFEKWSLTIAAALMMMSFIRIWHESSGGGIGMIFYFVRVFLMLLLLGSTLSVVETMTVVGQEIARGNEMLGPNGKSVLYEFYWAQRESFNTSYEKFTQGHFTVKVKGQDFTVKPTIDGVEAILGVTYDSESTIRDFNTKFSDTSYSLPLMFAWLNAARGIVDFGDFWLIGLSGLLLMVMKVSAPMMVAVAVDQKMAHKISYPFAWGLVVLTLIWPSVSYFIRAIAYLFGNVVMALGDADYLYAWNDVTMAAIRDPLFAQPLYTVGICAFFMTIAGVAVWFSPWLAYKFSMGQVYEGVSQVASSTAGGLIGAAVEWYSANMAGHIQQQASTTQAQGAYSATGAEAKANREAGLARNQAGYVTGKASALSAAQTSAGMAMAAGRAGMSQAHLMFGSVAGNKAGYNERMTDVSTLKEVTSIRSQNTLALGGLATGNAESGARSAFDAKNQKADTFASTLPLGVGGSKGAVGGGVNASASIAGAQKSENILGFQSEMGTLNQHRVAQQKASASRGEAIAEFAAQSNAVNRTPETRWRCRHAAGTARGRRMPGRTPRSRSLAGARPQQQGD
ncbi:MAG: hypothetical protein WKF30_15385, partial [Pyrinomonadaceae bacterium]